MDIYFANALFLGWIVFCFVLVAIEKFRKLLEGIAKMKFSTSTRSVFVASALLIGAASASEQIQEDSLHSKRNLGKRFVDEQGNYNICESTIAGKQKEKY